jgi:hypothetical protein
MGVKARGCGQPVDPGRSWLPTDCSDLYALGYLSEDVLVSF